MEGSGNAVFAALVGNILVAAAKFVAAALSMSGAMLTEAVHSTADILNQLLLILGNRLARRPPDVSHPFGYQGEIYFWTFVVSVLILFAGGAVSLWEGVHGLIAPSPIEAPMVSLVVLALSTLFEGGSLFISVRESQAVRRRHAIPGEKVGFLLFAKRSKDPNLFEPLLEDTAALIGIAIAAAGVALAAYAGLPRADSAASVGIGVLLTTQAVMIARSTRSLVANEGASPPMLRDMRRALETCGPSLDGAELRTLQLGPRQIIVFIGLEDGRAEGLLPADLALATTRLKEVDNQVDEVFFKLSVRIEQPEPGGSIRL